MFQSKCNYIASRVLQTDVQSEFWECDGTLTCQENMPVNFSQLNKESQNASNSTCYLDSLKTLIKWAGFYYNK